MHAEPVPSLAQADFKSFIEASTDTVLVDFWAPWCGPCRAMAPHLERLAADAMGHIAVRKVNVDEAPVLAAEFGIRSIPTLVLFKAGKPVSNLIGLQTEQQIKSWIGAAV
jgi:thioredoxin